MTEKDKSKEELVKELGLLRKQIGMRDLDLLKINDIKRESESRYRSLFMSSRFVLKPFDPDELLAKIKKIVG